MNYGVTPPFSNQGPSPAEMVHNEDMETFLCKSGAVYETQAGEHNRICVIDKLRVIIMEWAATIGKSKSIVDEICTNGGGIQLRIFGSTRLGVHNTDSDIDLLCLAPSFINRADFFGSFLETLSSRHDVDSILSVPEAFTPVLKFAIDGQPIDMVFASLQLTTLPGDLNIHEVHCLKGLDDASIRSVNGARVAEWILRLVPNTITFCVSLRIVKYWARQRGMYSNMLGFLGGVNYAILVAMVCQLYPAACPFTLVLKFFEIFSLWPWPAPVMLRPYEDLQLSDTDGRYLAVWNAKANYKDAMHIMPIITPAYPAMNSAYNVSPPQFRAFQDEVQRACSIFQRHVNEPRFPWARLFESSTREFFQRHPRYVQIDISASNIDDQRSWFGWVESRLRLLILALEQPPMVFCHPIANCFHRSPPVIPDFCRSPAPHCAADWEPVQEVLASQRIQLQQQQQQPQQTTASSSSPSVGTTLTTSTTSASASVSASSTRSPSPNVTPAVAQVGGVEPSDAQVCDDSAFVTLDNGCSANGEGVAPTREPTSKTTNSPPPVKTKAGKNGKGEKNSNNNNSNSNNEDEVSCYTSTFIIGLSFQNGTKFVDVGPAIQEFDYKVKTWSGRKEGMSLEISIFDSRNIPKFVFRTKAEPSNVESCTPKPSRARVNSFATATATTAETTTGAALGQPTQLFPSSAVKAPMHRGHSDSSLLSQGLSNHCISDDSVAAATATAARRYETSPVGNQRQQQSQRALNHSRSPRGDLHPHPPHHSHQHNQSSRPVNVNDFRSSPLGGPGSPASSSHAHTRMSTISALPPPVYVNAYRGVPPPQDIPYTAGNGVSNGALPLYLPVGAASHLQENQVPHRLPISNQHAVRDGALSGYGNNDEYRPHDHTMNGKQRSHSLSSDPRRAGRLADNGALPLQYVAYGTAPPPGMISFSSSAPAPVSAPVHSSNHAAFVYQQQQQQHGASDVIPPVLLSDHSPVPMSAVHAPPPPPGSAVPSPQGGYRTGQAAGSPRPLPFPHIQQDYYRASPNFQQSVLDGPRHQQHSDLFPPPLSVVPITTHDINSHDNSSGSYSGRSNGSSSGSLSPSKRYHKELLVPSSASSHGSADSHASSSSSSDNRRKK